MKRKHFALLVGLLACLVLVVGGIAAADVGEVEPNDTPAQANAMAIGDTASGSIDTDEFARDVDWFSFPALAGDVVRMTLSESDDYWELWSIMWDPDGDFVAGTGYSGRMGGTGLNTSALTVLIPRDEPAYYAQVEGCYYDEDYCDPNGNYDLVLERTHSLYVSALANNLGGNKATSRSDIATRDPITGDWLLVFDASDVGINKNLFAFEWTSAGNLLLVLQQPQTIPGLGRVKPNDILRFDPETLGEDTDGTLSFFMKGADVGLTTGGERIDALAWEEAYPESGSRLLVSLVGNGRVPQTGGGELLVRDEDLIALDQFAPGQPVQGTWSMHLDGSELTGLAPKDLSAATVSPWQEDEYGSWYHLWSTVVGSWRIDGVSGNHRDVLALENYNGHYWAASMAAPRLTNKPIDALSLGPVWTP